MTGLLLVLYSQSHLYERQLEAANSTGYILTGAGALLVKLFWKLSHTSQAAFSAGNSADAHVANLFLCEVGLVL